MLRTDEAPVADGCQMSVRLRLKPRHALGDVETFAATLLLVLASGMFSPVQWACARRPWSGLKRMLRHTCRRGVDYPSIRAAALDLWCSDKVVSRVGKNGHGFKSQ